MSENIYKAYRYRLYPNREVQSIFNQWFGCCRKVFNVTLDESIKQHEAGNKEFINRKSMFSMITKLKADGEHDYLKQVPIHTSLLVNENQVISIEDLAISKMSRNHKLAKSLLDEGWYQFTNMLEYKMEWYGGSLVKIDRFFPSSKTCSACGCKVSKMPLNVREWVCPDCGCVHDRDINAAQNILTEGLRLLNL